MDPLWLPSDIEDQVCAFAEAEHGSDYTAAMVDLIKRGLAVVQKLACDRELLENDTAIERGEAKIGADLIDVQAVTQQWEQALPAGAEQLDALFQKRVDAIAADRASEYLRLARELSKRPEEGMRRLAIQAAYQCAFNVARFYVTQVLQIELQRTDEVLDRVWDELDRNFQRIASKRGRELQKASRQADHEDLFPGDLAAAASKALSDADEVVKRLGGEL